MGEPLVDGNMDHNCRLLEALMLDPLVMQRFYRKFQCHLICKRWRKQLVLKLLKVMIKYIQNVPFPVIIFVRMINMALSVHLHLDLVI